MIHRGKLLKVEVRASTLTGLLARTRAKSIGSLQQRRSGAFVSPDGLIVTNHHIGADALAEAKSQGQGLFTATGSYARSRVEELKCPDLELKCFFSRIEDVTVPSMKP